MSAIQLVGKTDIKCASDYLDLLVEFQCENNLASRIFDSNRMRRLMMIYDSSFDLTSNSDNVELHMHGYYERLTTSIKEELNGGLISIKFDLASRRHRSVLGITIQYIRKWKIVIRTIAMLTMNGSNFR